MAVLTKRISILIFALFGWSMPGFAAELNFKLFDEVSEEALSNFNLEIRRADIDEDLLRKIEQQSPGNGTIIGRQEIIYTRMLSQGPSIGAYNVSSNLAKISLDNLAEGSYKIIASKTGYEAKSATFEIAENNSKDLAISLNVKPNYGKVYLFVKDQDGNAVANAKVYLKNHYFSYKATTNSDGIFDHRQVQQGVYRLAVAGPRGYSKFLETEFWVKESIDKSIKLTRAKSGGALLTVLDLERKPIPNLDIQVLPNEGLIAEEKLVGLFSGYEDETTILADLNSLFDQNLAYIHTRLSEDISKPNLAELYRPTSTKIAFEGGAAPRHSCRA